MTIAAVVISKDEEKNIADCLESLRWADELIVVDAESRDRTVELAKQYTPKVFVRRHRSGRCGVDSRGGCR